MQGGVVYLNTFLSLQVTLQHQASHGQNLWGSVNLNLVGGKSPAMDVLIKRGGMKFFAAALAVATVDPEQARQAKNNQSLSHHNAVTINKIRVEL